MGSTKRKVHHLLKMKNNQRKKGAYTNWFQLYLWPPIATAIKRHGNNSNALHFLKTTYKKTNIPSPYEKLSKACLSKWFTTSSELKPNCKHAVELDTIMKPNKQNYSCIGGIPIIMWFFHCHVAENETNWTTTFN
jgi:hypothetical protein